MNHTLLRRPLPSKEKNGPKKPVKLPTLNQNCHNIQDKNPKNSAKNFDIFEDGDKNLMKPLGPEPFYPKYSSK